MQQTPPYTVVSAVCAHACSAADCLLALFPVAVCSLLPPCSPSVQLSRPEPDRGGASGHDQRGRCRWQRHHRLPGVPHHDGAQDEGYRQRGGDQGGVQGLRQGWQRVSTDTHRTTQTRNTSSLVCKTTFYVRVSHLSRVFLAASVCPPRSVSSRLPSFVT